MKNRKIVASLFLFAFLILISGLVFAGNCSSMQCYNGNFCEDYPNNSYFYALENNQCNVYRYGNCTCNEGKGWDCKLDMIGSGVASNICESRSEECLIGMRKYEASGCDTKVRNCCNDKTWSDLSGNCKSEPSSECSSDTCWDGTECTARGRCPNMPPESNFVSAECLRGSGWRYTCWCPGQSEKVTYTSAQTPKCPDKHLYRSTVVRKYRVAVFIIDRNKPAPNCGQYMNMCNQKYSGELNSVMGSVCTESAAGCDAGQKNNCVLVDNNGSIRLDQTLYMAADKNASQNANQNYDPGATQWDCNCTFAYYRAYCAYKKISYYDVLIK